jgi:hypothetical protein
MTTWQKSALGGSTNGDSVMETRSLIAGFLGCGNKKKKKRESRPELLNMVTSADVATAQPTG